MGIGIWVAIRVVIIIGVGSGDVFGIGVTADVTPRTARRRASRVPSA